MTRIGEQDFLEAGPRVAGALQLENQHVTDQSEAWVGYLAQVAEWGGAGRG